MRKFLCWIGLHKWEWANGVDYRRKICKCCPALGEKIMDDWQGEQ